jgi:hypothetical protein
MADAESDEAPVEASDFVASEVASPGSCLTVPAGCGATTLLAASADAVVVGESDGFVVASEVLDAVVVVFAGAVASGALTCAVFGATGAVEAIVAVKPPLFVAFVAFAPFAWVALVWVACGFAGATVAAFVAA